MGLGAMRHGLLYVKPMKIAGIHSIKAHLYFVFLFLTLAAGLDRLQSMAMVLLHPHFIKLSRNDPDSRGTKFLALAMVCGFE